MHTYFKRLLYRLALKLGATRHVAAALEPIVLASPAGRWVRAVRSAASNDPAKGLAVARSIRGLLGADASDVKPALAFLQLSGELPVDL